MSRFLTPEDFTGKYKISKNCYDEATVQSFIDKYEDFYICQLLGAELSEEFFADLDGSNQPQTQKFIDIFQAFCKDSNAYSLHLQNCILQSEGMVEMLKGFIYYHYVTSENVRHTITGLTKSINENSSSANFEMIYRTAEIRHNEAVETYINIQEFIFQNLSVYPNLNGVRMNVKFYGIL